MAACGGLMLQLRCGRQVARSHGPGREWAPSEAEATEALPFTKRGYFWQFGGWLRGVSLPSNIERSGGERDAEDDDPYAIGAHNRLTD